MIKRSIVAFVCAIAFGTFVSTSEAQIKWLGTTSNDIFDESNWDFGDTGVTVVDPNVTIDADALIGPGPFTFDPVIPQVDGQQRFQLADGRAFTLDGVSLTVAGNDGFGGEPATENGPTVNVIGGGQFDPFFVVNDVSVFIDGTSSATFGGGGNPINLSTVDLSPGGVFAFVNETPDAFRAEHLSKTTVLGAPAVEGANVMIEAMGATGSTITVVPEPSASLLAMIGVLALGATRRK